MHAVYFGDEFQRNCDSFTEAVEFVIDKCPDGTDSHIVPLD